MELIPGIWYENQYARWGQAWESAKSALLEKLLLSFLQYRVPFPFSNFKLNSTHCANDLEIWATTLTSYFLSPSWSNHSSSWPLPYLRPSSNSLSFAVTKEYSRSSIFHHSQGSPSEIPSDYDSPLLNNCQRLPMWEPPHLDSLSHFKLSYVLARGQLNKSLVLFSLLGLDLYPILAFCYSSVPVTTCLVTFLTWFRVSTPHTWYICVC